MFCIHTDDQNLLQMIYQIFGTYYEDNCGDGPLERSTCLTADHIPLFNRMDDSTLWQFSHIMWQLRKKIYSISMPEFVLFDIDTTLLATYGIQEVEGFNYHYQAHGYHPLMCYYGLTDDLINA